ncbi:MULTISPECIES: flagellar export protein FliJ [Niallia]|uniref:Flagellar FliJ protein n=1 Tax=Niallia alba TaxID=2729105 RepID=A0A7Y0K7R3_9BACI|nr:MULTISPECIES: flagellar export protein FliJ [Niallia]NMO77346.1 flagellar biosynthesis chaperone FliJ [Niallia alba]UTI40554.1 flagellar biosynthesis chaperone FliJ [Niallia sp. RD1]
MSYQFKFEKILTIREREKEEASSAYNLSVNRFEEAAEKLYELLKRKEDLEAYQAEKMTTGLSVQEIRHHQQFVGNLTKTIEHAQKMVQNARNSMVYFQEKMLEKNIEVKKFVKIKEKDHSNFVALEKLEEAKQMDDISLQQYMQQEKAGG